MKNKKLYVILPFVVILIAAAAFIGGRLLNGQTGFLGFLSPNNGEIGFINILPASELPVTQPDVNGTLVERQDNIFTVQTFSMEVGSGGGAIVSYTTSDMTSVESTSGESTSGDTTTLENGNDGPKVEVVITKETKIYQDVTDFELSMDSVENQTIQQVVKLSSMDAIGTQAMITVWGRKNGDRIIADVVMYTNLNIVQP